MLEHCLESLVKQTRMPNEVIVVDNSSTDNAKKVILSFRKKLPIRYIVEKQIGIPYARNKGIKSSHGTLLLMLDDDCEADKFWVERMEKAQKKYKKAWVIQGKTNSVPDTKPYSLLAEFNRSLSMRNYAKTIPPLSHFFSQNFKDEIRLLTCDTKNFSIKTSYFKEYKLSFDEHFYRGSDTDFGRQIVQKNGLIMFCPSIQVSHWERSTLLHFLEQRWHIGRTGARIADKWKRSIAIKMSALNKFLAFLLFCKTFNLWRNFPVLTAVLFLDKLYYLNGWFFEKRILSLQKQ